MALFFTFPLFSTKERKNVLAFNSLNHGLPKLIEFFVKIIKGNVLKVKSKRKILVFTVVWLDL